MSDEIKYANIHIAPLLDIPLASSTCTSHDSCVVQTITKGSLLTSRNLLLGKLSLQRPILVLDTAESIGMKLPKPETTISDIAPLVGPSLPVRVIDVRTQQELEGWTFQDLVDYFEDDTRRVKAHPTRSSRPAKRKAQQSLSQARVLNQISLEFSHSQLGEKVRSPQFVRDLDWIDKAWDPAIRNTGQYPVVQYYCLTSSAGCYTDFHIDFGGTSVWYHVLNGSKQFCLIAPTPENLDAYEKWLCSDKQSETFLPNVLPDKSSCLRIHLQKGQTFIIPSGWIHAVYTPDDSLVFGGNFLHGLDIILQIDVYSIETRTKVLSQYRFPFFVQTHFYAGSMYLKKIRNGKISTQEMLGLGRLIEALEMWWSAYKTADEDPSEPTVKDAAKYAYIQNNCTSVEHFLSTLKIEYNRMAINEGIPTLSVPKDVPLFKLTPPSPRLRLKVTHVQQGVSIETDQNDIKITIPQNAAKAEPLPADVPVSHSRPVDDGDWYVDQEAVLKEEEWMPNPRKTKRGGTKAPSNGTKATSTKRPKMTARQRLMNKFR